MKMKELAIIFIVVLCLCAGCVSPEVREACQRCRLLGSIQTNTPVNVIEELLDLPRPVKTRAPATIDPVWRFIYYADGFSMGFAAEQVSGDFPIGKPADSRNYMYLGDMWVSQGVTRKLDIEPVPDDVVRAADEAEKERENSQQKTERDK